MNKVKKFKVAVDSGFNDSYKELLEATLGKFDIVTFDKLIGAPRDNDVKLLMFTGGADVNPDFYGEAKGSHTGINPKRDDLENHIFNDYFGVPKLGICRGSQFLTVMAGGRLIQHVEGHATGSDHSMTCKMNWRGENNNKIMVTSTHHQMLFPFNMQKGSYHLLGWSSKFLSDTYLNGNDQQIKIKSGFLEPEVVFYPEVKSLAIQGHPEFGSATAQFKKYTGQLIERYLLRQN